MKKNWFLMIAVVLVLMLSLSACGEKSEAAGGEGDIARPSNAGGAGEAVNLKGDAAKGATVYAANCVACHGAEGKGGVANPGSKDGTVPELNPIDSTLVNADYKTFATNIDLFIEHGSTPEIAGSGQTPAFSMVGFGDNKQLQPQDIADVIAYVISLNEK